MSEADEEKIVTEFINKLNDLWTRKSEECPHCGKHVEALDQVRRSVYVRPCGHRLGQGQVPKAWKGQA